MEGLQLVRCGRLLWTDRGITHTTDVKATTDGARFFATGRTGYGERFEAEWLKEDCRPDGTIAGMLGYTFIRDALLPITGHCHRPGCQQLFYGCRSNKMYCGPEDGDRLCYRKHESLRKAFVRQRAREQRQATGGTVR